MKGQSLRNVSSFCERILSSLPASVQVFASYFIDGNSTEPQNAFDYEIIVVSLGLDVPFPLYPISDAKQLSFLECLLLKEVIKYTDPSDSFVLGARFGPRVNRGVKGKILSPLEIVSSKEKDFMDDLLKNLAFASRRYLLSDFMPPVGPLSTVPDLLKAFIEALHKEEALDDISVSGLNLVMYLVIFNVGLGKLLTIPELDPKQQRQEPPLTKEDASRIHLLQDVVQPRDGIRPTIDPSSIKAHWARVPARLFLYGPILDFVSALREKRIVKVCWNCGKLYRPVQYQEERQRYCSDRCQNRAQSKRRYQRKKKGTKNQS